MSYNQETKLKTIDTFECIIRTTYRAYEIFFIKIHPDSLKLFNLNNFELINIKNPLNNLQIIGKIFEKESLEKTQVEISPDFAYFLNIKTNSIVKLERVGELARADHLCLVYNSKLTNKTTSYFEKINLLTILSNRPVSTSFKFFYQGDLFEVAKIISKGLSTRSMQDCSALVGPTTAITIRNKIDYDNNSVFFQDIGGLSDVIEKIQEMTDLPLKHSKLFKILNSRVPRGLLLLGPPGTGKTMLAKAIANKQNYKFYLINGPELNSKFLGDTEKKLRTTFDNARANSPSIIFIDQLDSLAGTRDKTYNQAEKRIVGQLLTLMDGVNDRGEVLVIASTNLPENVDSALTRTGRFDRSIEISPPNVIQRKEILDIILRATPLSRALDTGLIAKKTSGFVGSDLQALVNESAISSIRRFLNKKKESLDLDQIDFEEGLKTIKPSTLFKYAIEKPDVKWSDIGGLNHVIEQVLFEIENTLKYEELLTTHNFKTVKGILLWGPSGTGKTMLAKAIATELDIPFIKVDTSDILSKWVGESEKEIRALFKRARSLSPSLLFFDQIDCLFRNSNSTITNSNDHQILNQFLTELDGIKELKGVIVLAATNKPETLETSLIRSGRFDRKIKVDRPNSLALLEIFKINLKKVLVTREAEDYLAELSRICFNIQYTGAEVANITRTAVLLNIKRKEELGLAIEPLEITKEDLSGAFQYIKNNFNKTVRESV